jgi:pSer/pThr/pTyr-binding forkhead associated (FHA) protein
MVQASNTSITFPVGKPQVIAGREDPISNVFPDINMDPHGGDEGGVSRQHARFYLQGTQWYIEDLNSINFTRVNNQRIHPNQPHLLNGGDQIQLGRVKLTFYLT